ncbi:flavodoxin [Candidatus Moduliflexus flocculans]|uniref:Flavodoxin n=1 Tax=Candidatus Moduliflexus flocculans TaxID=1499966 RepID=A0A081BRN4_9BACT|nr:flavodoxin [Candidatus Moduliflexus flocculans]
MPKSLVIYYSLEGNTALIAKAVAETLQADLLELQPVKNIPNKGFFKFFWGGKQVMMKEQPELQPFSLKPAEYDLIVLGTPVWASSYVPAFRTFLAQYPLKDKQVGLFCCYAGNEGKTIEALKTELSGNIILGNIGFLNPAKTPEASAKTAKEWAKSLLENAGKK